MPSELKRGAIRLGSNYARLFLFLLLGIFFVPIFMLGTGDAGLGLLGLLGSSIGIAEMCNEIVRNSLNRELGTAYHSDDPEEFPDTYNAAIVLTTALALVTALLFIVLALCLPLFNIPEEMRGAAMWLLVCKGAYSFLLVLLGPQFNMYLVTERMVLFNIWTVGQRAAEFLTAFILFIILGMRDPAAGMKAFAVTSAGSMTLVLLIAVVTITIIDPRLIPQPSRIRMNKIRQVLSTAGWNSIATTAMNMHIRLDNILMNMFGIIHNTGFTLATRLTGYVRVVAGASTQGLDVVSARLSEREGQQRVEELMQHSTRIHALIALPAGLIVLLLAEPLMTLWVGRSVQEPQSLQLAIVLTQVLVVGMTARGISDCWVRTLYGAGHIRAYAPLILLGGVLNPILALLLIFALPEGVNHLGPALAFSSIFVVVHFMIIPVIAARCLKVATSRIMLPVLKPAIATMIASPILFLPRMGAFDDSLIVMLISLALFASQILFLPRLDAFDESLIVMLISLTLFGLAMVALAWLFVLGAPERQRISSAVLRRIHPSYRPDRERSRNLEEGVNPEHKTLP